MTIPDHNDRPMYILALKLSADDDPKNINSPL